jgi:pyrroline-5-carboxylate reductase
MVEIVDLVPGSTRIGVIGAGSMGQALIAGWVNSGVAITAVVRDQAKYQFLENQYGIAVSEDLSVLADCGIVVLAIKPQILKEILSELAAYIAPETILISVAAGITTTFIGDFCPQTDQIIRAMPNTPSIIGRGVTGMSGSPRCSAQSMHIARQLMSAVGLVVEIPEAQQNDLAAVSGSGPAYLFYLAEAMVAGAIELGLSTELADQLVRETLIGAAGLLENSEVSPAELRRQVTSPGGMTAASMGVLEQHHVDSSISSAMKQGVERATELGK